MAAKPEKLRVMASISGRITVSQFRASPTIRITDDAIGFGAEDTVVSVFNPRPFRLPLYNPYGEFSCKANALSPPHDRTVCGGVFYGCVRSSRAYRNFR